MPPKKSSPNEGLSQLKLDLKLGQIGTLYLFYGDEDYLRDHYLEQLQKKLVDKGMESFNLHTFQGKDLEFVALSEAVDAMPMMSERTMVVVWDWDLFKNEQRREQVQTMVEDLPEYVCLVFAYDTMEFKPNGNTKLGKALKQRGVMVEFQAQGQSDLNNWMRRRLAKRWDKDIDPATAEYLTFLCGGLMTNLSGELDKAGAYAKGKVVTKRDIDAVCDPVLDARAFQMTDALSSGKYDRAMELLGQLLRMGESPVFILAALGRQLRQIWSARLALEQRKGDNYLAQLWGIKSGWQLRKLWEAARGHSLRWCRQAVALVQEADWQMKLGGAEEEILTDLILRLAVPGKGDRR